MRFVGWAAKVLIAVGESNKGNLGPGAGLAKIGETLGYPNLHRDDFVAREGPAGGLMTAMDDLEDTDLVQFQNVDYGCTLTGWGRDVVVAGLPTIYPDIFDIVLSPVQIQFLARLHESCLIEGDAWASFQFADADVIYAEIGLPSTEYADTIERFTFLGDLEKKGMVKREHRTMGSTDSYRPTLAGAIVVTEPNPLPGAGRAGLIDWSVPTPGFDAVERELGDLKVKLLAATSDADLSDVGLRCRRILVETMQAVYRTEMVPEGVTPPSPQDADEMLRHFLASRLTGKDHEPYRRFIRGAWALASARVHADRTGRAAAFAATQGTISFVRAIQAIERERPREE
jgi:hypothetical protein